MTDLDALQSKVAQVDQLSSLLLEMLDDYFLEESRIFPWYTPRCQHTRRELCWYEAGRYPVWQCDDCGAALPYWGDAITGELPLLDTELALKAKRARQGIDEQRTMTFFAEAMTR